MAIIKATDVCDVTQMEQCVENKCSSECLIRDGCILKHGAQSLFIFTHFSSVILAYETTFFNMQRYYDRLRFFFSCVFSDRAFFL